MTTGQTRVLMILLAAMGIEALFSVPMRNALAQLRKGTTGDAMNALTSIENGGTFAALGAYMLALVAIVAFAAPAPNAATWIAVLVLVYALLSHGSEIVPFVSTLQSSIGALGGTNTAPKSA